MSEPPPTLPSLLDVDAAVSSVLAELFSARRFNGSASRGPGAPGGGEVFAGRLLSLREAEKLQAGLREVNVAPGTVVTPLARDFLKRAGVVIRFVSRAETQGAANVGEWGFACEKETGVVEAFRRSLLDGSDGWRDLGASADAASRWVSEAASRGALVLTDESAVAVFRACRVAGVRAAAADDAGAAARAVRSLGVNLLVVEPAGKPVALLRQIGSTFRRGGGPVPPDWIEDPRGGGAS